MRTPKESEDIRNCMKHLHKAYKITRELEESHYFLGAKCNIQLCETIETLAEIMAQEGLLPK